MVCRTNQSGGPFFSLLFSDLSIFAKSGHGGALTGEGGAGGGLRSGFHVSATWHDETGWGDCAEVGPGAAHVGHVVSNGMKMVRKNGFRALGVTDPLFWARTKTWRACL